MESLGDILPNRINKLGLSNELQAAYIVSKVNSVSNGRFLAVSYSQGVLVISCPNSIVAGELQFASADIIKEINSVLKTTKIKRLKFKITE